MTAKSHSRGYEIIFKDNTWVYSDTLHPIEEYRPCKKCGELPTSEGYDACLGYIEGVISACCGHGVEDKKIMKGLKMKLKINKIQCKHCEDIIESKRTHDFKYCKCGKVFVDGGLEYGRRGFPTSPDSDFIELSEYRD